MNRLAWWLCVLLLWLPALAEEKQEVEVLDLSQSVIDFQFKQGTPVFVRNREVKNPNLVYLSDDLLVPVKDLKKLLAAEELGRIYTSEKGVAIDGIPVVYQGLKPGYVPLFRLLDALDFKIRYEAEMAIVDAVPASAGQGSAQPAGPDAPPRGRLKGLLGRTRVQPPGKPARRDENWQMQREHYYDAQENIDRAIDAYVANPPVIVAPRR